MQQIEKYLYLGLVIMALSIIIWPTYYITGDGASHTYNAKVLFDVVLNRERDFYQSFYSINRSIDPNWMSHLGIGLLIQFVPGWMADKIFQIIYVLLFAYGFRYLISSIFKENSFLSFLFFPYVFSLPFQQGFYNYCISLALLFWSVGFYIRNKNRMDNPIVQFSLSFLLLCTTFSHGMPAIYALIIISLIWLFSNYLMIWQFQLVTLKSELARLALIFLPSAFIILLFMAKRGSGTVPHAWSMTKKWIEFLKLWTLQSTRQEEIYPALATGILTLVICILALLSKKFMQQSKPIALVFLVMSFFFLLSYIQCPHSIGGAGSIDIRLGFLPPLFILIFVASFVFKPIYKKVFIASSFLIAFAFLSIRFPYVVKANEIAKEIMKAGKYIDNKSVVMNINMDAWQQLPNGDSVFHKDGSFIHIADYLGTEKNKHLILLMNYEAEINYFPVNWAPLRNPRISVAGLIPGTYPPCGNPLDYEIQVAQKLDYVLLYNLRNYKSCTPQLQGILDNEFYKVYTNAYVAVYKRIP